MTDKQARRRAVEGVTPAQCGVFRVVNTATGKAVLATTKNLKAARNRFEFAMSTSSYAALDQRLVPDAKIHGWDSLRFEILDELENDPSATPASVADDLATLETLWLERIPADDLY